MRLFEDVVDINDKSLKNKDHEKWLDTFSEKVLHCLTCKLFFVADKYVGTIMFRSRIERFCASELSGAGKTCMRYPCSRQLQKCISSRFRRNFLSVSSAFSG